MRKNTRAYFGGGVYAECTGFDIVLTANGVGNAATDRIHLDPQMIRELLEWQEAGYPDHETGKKFGVEETVWYRVNEGKDMSATAKKQPRLGDKEYDAEVNEPHLENPEPGDYWQEMFCPVMVVLARIGKHVIVCKKTKAVDHGYWTWDLDEIEMMTLDAMREYVSYGSIPGYWCDCMPRAHEWAVEAVGLAK